MLFFGCKRAVDRAHTKTGRRVHDIYVYMLRKSRVVLTLLNPKFGDRNNIDNDHED